MSSDLLERAQDHEQEPGIAFGDFAGMPFHGGPLVAVASPRGADGQCGREPARERQVDAGREEGVDEAARVAGDAHVGTRVRRGAVGPI